VRPPRDLAGALRRRMRGGGWPPYLPANVPVAPSGWTVAPPDFVGVGAQKAGTTWWYGLLAAHPAVHLVPGRRKELHYFDRFWEQPFSTADAVRYHSFFPRPAGGKAGEWTPRYMVDFWTPALLHEAAPDAKILVMLRDPFERFCSGVAHELAHRAPHHAIVPELGVEKSAYGRQLASVLASFERAAVLVLQYERCCLDPRGELRRTLEHIGLDDFEPSAALLGPQSDESRRPRYEPGEKVRAAFVATIADDLTRLIADFPEIDPALWPSCARL
jgi:Sulfotransferase family